MKNSKKASYFFGFSPVDEHERQPRVNDVFASVAHNYDVMNDAMSMGWHRQWKDALVAKLAPWPGRNYLDLAGGTGDIAFRIQQYMQQQHKQPDTPCEGSVHICDINPSMLEVGRERAMREMRQQHTPTLEWVTGNAESLPFTDTSMDGCTMAFGIRNVTHRDAALKEIKRTLKTGRAFHCMEFSPAMFSLARPAYDAYSFKVIPALGQLLAKDRNSYQYLVESIRQFPEPQAFEDELRDAGFIRVSHLRLSGGAVTIHTGWSS